MLTPPQTWQWSWCKSMCFLFSPFPVGTLKTCSQSGHFHKEEHLCFLWYFKQSWLCISKLHPRQQYGSFLSPASQNMSVGVIHKLSLQLWVERGNQLSALVKKYCNRVNVFCERTPSTFVHLVSYCLVHKNSVAITTILYSWLSTSVPVAVRNGCFQT